MAKNSALGVLHLIMGMVDCRTANIPMDGLKGTGVEYFMFQGVAPDIKPLWLEVRI